MAKAGTVWVDVRTDGKLLGGDIVRSATAAAAAASGIALAGLGASAVRESTEFNKAVSGVGAVANATASELEALRQAALQAGADTAFSASEAAVAEAELTRAGIDTADVLGGALAGSLDLAAAGQLGLGDAATISAQALNTFNLEGDQTGHVADVLAAGANKSAADVGQLGQALAQGGLVAKQTGLDFEDTVGILALFADNALVGSDAGTSLKTTLQRLVPQSAEAGAAMKAAGLDFFDAQGNFVGIDQVAQQLQDRLSGLSTEQRQTALTTIFGADAIRAASLLYEAGAEGVQEYVAAVNDQGAAQEMASAQLDNLAGDLEQLRGSWETLMIGLGSSADSGLREVVQALTEGVNTAGEFATSPVFDVFGEQLGGILTAVAGGIGDVTENVDELLGGLDPEEVRAFFASLHEGVDGLEGPLIGLLTSLATLSGGSLLSRFSPGLAGLLPGLSPVQGAIAGIVLQSEEGREALGSMLDAGVEAADAAAPVLGLVADILGTVADQGWLVKGALDALIALKVVNAVEPWITKFQQFRGTLRGTWQELAERGAMSRVAADVATVGTAAETAVVPVARLGQTTAQIAPEVGAIGPAAASSVGGVATLSSALAALNAEQLALSAGTAGGGVKIDADVIDVDSWEVFGELSSGAAQDTAKIAAAADTAGASVGRFGSTVGDVARGGLATLRAGVGTLLSSLAGPAGLTAGIAAGLYIYQDWEAEQERVEKQTDDLTRAILTQLDVLSTQSIGDQLRASLEDAGADDAFDKIGLRVSDLASIIGDAPDDFDKFRDGIDGAFGSLDSLTNAGDGFAAGGDIAGLREQADLLSPAAQGVANDLIDMFEQGKITKAEFGDLTEALAKTSKATDGAGDSLKRQAERLKEEAGAAAFSAHQQELLNTAMDVTQPIENRRDALAELSLAFPTAAGAAGIAKIELEGVDTSTRDAGNAAETAGGQILGLAGDFGVMSAAAVEAAQGALQLLDLQDADADASRRVADARQKLAEIESGSSEALDSAREQLVDADNDLAKALEDNARKTEDALRRVEEARDKLEAAREKGAVQGTGGIAAPDQRPDLSIAREIRDAQRGLAEAEQEYGELASGNSDQIVSAKERQAEAQRKVNEETAKVGPSSKAAADAREELSDAERAAAGASLELQGALGAVTADSIPAQIAALQALATQYGLSKTEVDALIGSLLVQLATSQEIAEVAGRTPPPPLTYGEIGGNTYPQRPVPTGAGRAFGGPVWSGALVPVNELGEPEMYSDPSGRQYLMPAAGGGQVTPLAAAGGGGVQLLTEATGQMILAALVASVNSRPNVTVGELSVRPQTGDANYRDTLRALEDATYGMR